MLSFQGYFELGKFVPLDDVSIPEHKRAIVTILDEVAPAKDTQNAKAWREFFSDLESCDEELTPKFDEVIGQRVNFRREIDL